MIWPPSVLRLHLAGAQRARIRLWLPLFILWPILLLLAILLAPLLALIAVLLCLFQHGRLVRAALILPRVFVATRGLSVSIDDRNGDTIRLSIR